MKKIIIICLCLILFSGCTKPEQLYEFNVTDVKSRIASSEELYSPIDIEKKLLIDENGCNVYVPWIVDEKYNDINVKIESFIYDRIDEVMETGWDDSFFINIDYTISYNQNEILSFYFLENSFIGWLSHEFLTGINIDLQSGNLIPITDLISIDESFLDELFSYRGDKYGREEYISDYLLDNFTQEEILENIKNEIGVSYYFSKEFVYVSFPLTQALTYHMEFGVKWKSVL